MRPIIGLDGEASGIAYERVWGQDFRYDSPRQRYLTRQLDTSNSSMTVASAEDWSWYAGNYPLDDYQVADEYDPERTRQYVFGVGQQDLVGGFVTTTGYQHGDMIGTTRAITDDSLPVQVVRRAVYTAFGELVTTTGSKAGSTLGEPRLSLTRGERFALLRHQVSKAAEPRRESRSAWGYQEHDVGSNGLLGTNGVPDGQPDSTINTPFWAG